ncbi:MAG: hypothetical protein QOF28_881 [Actinomycetota bacterium]|nr:hypothetical protein [Actinomycetota bacterium]
MSDSERRQRTISSTPRLTPEEVSGRTFATAFRGVSESDVRSFLKRVSEELGAARGREQELLGTIDELEARLRTPQPLDEQALLDALGEETTRLLRSAREAAADIRTKAEERAARLVHEAHEEAERLRQEAEEVLGKRTTEAESVAHGMLEEAEQRATDLMRVADERAAEVRAGADHYTADLRTRVERDAGAELDGAREEGRAMIEEAGSLRERIIDDLAQRRELLTGQLEELRAGRDRLLDAYRVVKRTFLEATEALAQVEARAVAARSVAGTDPADLAATVAAEGEAARIAGLAAEVANSSTVAADDAEHSAADTGGAEDEAADTAGSDGEDAEVAGDEAAAATAEAGTEPAAADATGDGASPNLADVDDLFARLRAGAHGDSTSDDSGEASDTAPGENGEVEIDLAADDLPDEGATAADDPPAWLSERDETLAPLRVALVRQVKLAIGDEQNEVLDKVRRQKGRPTAASVLPELDAQTAAWAAVVLPPASEAYKKAVGDDARIVPDDLADGIARAMVEPLRDRLVTAIDGTHEPGETTNQVAERIGARYREWKNHSAEASVEDALVGAYSRGRYDAAADDAVLTWRTPAGGCCPDCTDNALEPTRKGESFPTGQQYPPAHAGCRCTIVSGGPDAHSDESVEAESTASS